MADRLTVATLVQAGFEALEDNGLGGLTMRDVAQRLGVKAPAIYWHLKSRGDLIDEMATQMWREIYADVESQSEGLTPEDGLVVFARTVRKHGLARRSGARLIAGTYLTDDALLQAQHRRLLDAGSVAVQEWLIRAHTLVHSFVTGYVIEEQARRQAPERYDPERRAERLGLSGALTSSVQLMDTSDERFEELLELVMTTVRRDRT